jgi:hypothetical protein
MTWTFVHEVMTWTSKFDHEGKSNEKSLTNEKPSIGKVSQTTEVFELKAHKRW